MDEMSVRLDDGTDLGEDQKKKYLGLGCMFPVVSVYDDKQGKARQGRAGRPGHPLRGAGRGAISILKNRWGKPEDLHLIKQKYNFF
jgi:hypothetical protein